MIAKGNICKAFVKERQRKRGRGCQKEKLLALLAAMSKEPFFFTAK
jgi:hypothetical protein